MLTISGVVGVHSVAYAFPKVHLVTTAVDPAINDQFYILPGIGKHYCQSHSLFTVYCAVFSTKLLLVIFRSTPLTRPSKTSNVRPSIHKTSFQFQRNLIRKQRLMTNIWWHAVWPDPWSRSRMSESCENDQFQSQYACNQLTNSELRYFKTVFTQTDPVDRGDINTHHWHWYSLARPHIGTMPCWSGCCWCIVELVFERLMIYSRCCPRIYWLLVHYYYLAFFVGWKEFGRLLVFKLASLV